ncbi:MAG: polysaccharide deacetylase family protein [Bacteroidetes bacterium]|nr:polysaccharide deacetylase family protein [Bacteroidota bacterium]
MGGLTITHSQLTIRNFLFHRVSDETDALWPPMHPALFEKIIRYLTGNFKVVLLEDYLKDPSSYKREKNLATVCFDHGYGDNIEKAAPLLLRYRCPASFYVVTDCIDRNVPTWTYITDLFFQHAGNKKLQLENDFVPVSLQNIEWNNAEEAKEWGRKVKPWMKSLPNSQRLWVMQQIEQQNKGAGIPRKMMMSWSEVKELHEAGFYIGSHSHTHPMLASLAGEEELFNELSVSSEKIQQQLGEKPLTISYPIGSYDKRVITCSKWRDINLG